MIEDSRQPLLSVENLHAGFKTRKGWLHAVNGLSYTLDKSETLGIVGESGSGKSVHALSIMQLIPSPPGKITKGNIWFEGQNLVNLNKNEMRKIRGGDIAMIFQDPMKSLNPVLTIGEQIVEAIVLHQDLKKNEARELAARMLELVEISDAESRLNYYPHQFSGGMRQRAMIAMALSCNPKLLIADEPTTALDVTIQAQIIDLVKRLQEKLQMAVMWITHDLGIVARISQRINVMYAGSNVETGDVRAIYQKTLHPYTYCLLRSLPKMKGSLNKKLYSIPGSPPDLTRLGNMCSFSDRCPFSEERCRREKPELIERNEKGHYVACFNWQKVIELKENQG